VALFVNEATVLPLLVPLAPASSVLARFPTAVEAVFGRHGLTRSFIEAEISQMAERRLATAKSRSVVGIMSEFSTWARSSERRQRHSTLRCSRYTSPRSPAARSTAAGQS